MSEFITNAELRIEAERLCDENDQLREENSKLRDVESENASLRGAVQGLGELCDKYKAENAKLRRFAKMFAQVADEVGCDPCPYCNPNLCDEEIDPMRDGCRLYDELRELGVTDD